MPEQEEWKEIPDFPGYYASSLGRIRGKKGWIMKPHAAPDRYYKLNVRKEGSVYSRSVHALVALAFIGPRPLGMEVCHNNDNKLDNKPTNLRYDTHFGNMRQSRLTREEVLYIRERVAEVENCAKVAQDLGLSRCRVWSIAKGYTYHDWPGPLASGRNKPGSSKLTKELVQEIREIYGRGETTLASIGKKYGVSESAISLIVNNKRWKE